MFRDEDYRKIAFILDEYKDKENILLCEFMMFLKERNIKLEDMLKYVTEQEKNSLMALLLTPLFEILKKRINTGMELLGEFVNNENIE